jgi:hypothetical protein
MMDAGSREWMLGMPLLAMNFTFIITNNLAPILARKIGNWGIIALGLSLCVIAMITMPFCRFIQLYLSMSSRNGFSVIADDFSIIFFILKVIFYIPLSPFG